MNRTIGFIGGGRITAVFLQALSEKGYDESSVIVSECDPAVREKLGSAFPRISVTDDNCRAAAADTIFIAVHPPVFEPVLSEIRGSVRSDAIIISLAPKITVDMISSRLGGFSRIVRMIPNAASIIAKGFNPVYYSPAMHRTDRDLVLELVSCFGRTMETEQHKLEAYAVLTAMGPAFFFYQIFEIMSIVRTFGLDDAEVENGMLNMLEGMTAVMFSSGLSKEEILDLIPGKPMKPNEENVKGMYRDALCGIYKKLTE